MHPRLRPHLAAAAAAVMLTACSGANDVPLDLTGRLSLDVTADTRLSGTDLTAMAPRPEGIRVAMRSASGVYGGEWESVEAFPRPGEFLVGDYVITCSYGDPGDEGFARPYYTGEARVSVVGEETRTATVGMTLRSGAVTVDFEPGFAESFPSTVCTLHRPGGGYPEYPVSSREILYLPAGQASLLLSLSLSDGRRCGFSALDFETAEGALSTITVRAQAEADGTPKVTATCGGREKTTLLTEAFLDASPPAVVPTGWSPGQTIRLPEGDEPPAPVSAAIESSSPLSHLWLSVSSHYLRTKGLPEALDLKALTPEVEALLRSYGLRWNFSPEGALIDFTSLIGNLVYLDPASALSHFSLLAEDTMGRVGVPATLTVETTPVDITVENVAAIPVGTTEGMITVSASASGFTRHVELEFRDAAGAWRKVPLTDISEMSPGSYLMRFPMPEGSDPIEARILYCEEVRATFSILRVMPPVELTVDAFANHALIKVSADNPDLLPMLTERLRFYVDGEPASVLSRLQSYSTVIISGLRPAARYSLTATLMDKPVAADFTAPVSFTTETTPQLPNGDFEDRKTTIDVKGLPSGGRFSQTTVAIFNWQNHADFLEKTPNQWANTNAKTFPRPAANPNTWYMQPSVFTVSDAQNGDFAVQIRSVAFDPDGPEIPDYTQTGEPFLSYSPIVPDIRYRAAGRLFLGSYSFSPATLEETYTDKVPWPSRPVSLNGFYKYRPCDDYHSDRGIAMVEVFGMIDGQEQMIATAITRLPVATGYTAFSVPISYPHFGVKATAIRVMFASSEAIGTIEEESSRITTISDPQTATSVGSCLWLDNISLAY